MSKERSIRGKSLVLIGFMGVGKTTVGKILAKKLAIPLVDTDEEIVKAFDGIPIPEIFHTYGETAFRKKEKEIIKQLIDGKQQVLSLGGGAYTQEAVKRQCMNEAVVIFLDMTFAVWKERIPELIDSRPLLQNKEMTEIEELFIKRRTLYQDHHIRVLTDQLSPEEVTEKIQDALARMDD